MNDKLFRRIESLLRRKGSRITPNELRQLVLSYAIATDKRRLEEGEDQPAAGTLSPHVVFDEGQRRVLEMQRKAHEHRPRERRVPKKKGLQLVEDVEEERASREGHGA